MLQILCLKNVFSNFFFGKTVQQFSFFLKKLFYQVDREKAVKTVTKHIKLVSHNLFCIPFSLKQNFLVGLPLFSVTGTFFISTAAFTRLLKIGIKNYQASHCSRGTDFLFDSSLFISLVAKFCLEDHFWFFGNHLSRLIASYQIIVALKIFIAPLSTSFCLC